MAQKRYFQSIQAIPDPNEIGAVALLAVADDGSAWTAKTEIVAGYLDRGIEWKQINPLPVNQAINPQGLVL